MWLDVLDTARERISAQNIPITENQLITFLIVLGLDPGQHLLLTPYIENGEIEKARSLSKIEKLPNAQHYIPSHSGFITVNKKHNSNMFYWFFPSLNNDTKAPIILWLQGGPGASGLIGLFNIHGPYFILENKTAELRPYTWAKEFHMIYIDNPVGTGFSFTESEEGYVTNEEAMANDLYEFLQQFFKVHYEYKSNDLYIVGESYGGKYVPSIAYKIHKSGPPAEVTFKGIGIGNGAVDPITQMNYADYFYQLGIIDSKQALNIKNENYLEAVKLFNNIVADVPEEANPNYLLQFSGYDYTYFLLDTKTPQDMTYYRDYIRLPEFRKAVHVGNLTFHTSKKVRDYLLKDFMLSVKPQLIEIMNNYKVLIYNGQLDLTLPYTPMVEFLQSVEWKRSKEYKEAERKIWRLCGTDEIAGYVHNVGDFYHVLIRSSGHMAPHEQPVYALDLITRFVRDKPLY
ncbi:UNVERIFIED_CONTAM: serine carboxypeptidase CPVL [Trichonephila clavipes]